MHGVGKIALFFSVKVTTVIDLEAWKKSKNDFALLVYNIVNPKKNIK